MNNIEVEIKIKIAEMEEIKKKIISLDFKLIKPKFFEYNIIFDTNNKNLKKNCLLRLRKENTHNVLTLKRTPWKVSDFSRYKIREEIETEVTDFEKTKEILAILGFEIYFIYEKYREIYQKKNIKIMIDQTPIGDYIEIEAQKAKIDEVSHQLGFNKEHYINKSYYSLYRQHQQTGHMKFKT